MTPKLSLCYNVVAPTENPGSYQSNDGAPGLSACPRQRYGRKAMIDSSRRTVLTTGAAAAATAAAPQVFAQAPQTSAPQGAPAGAKTGYYEKGNVRIRYTEIGTGFPLLATPGGGLNSRIAVWANAVINIPEEFKNDFRVITMDQRNATGGESTGPVPVDDPWGAFADDQLGLMDHLGIRQFFFFGNCIGGPFAMKLMERAPQRVVAALLSQPVGHRPEQPDYMFNSGRDVWAKEVHERRRDVPMETIEKYLHSLYRVRPDFVYSVSRDFAKSCQTPMLVLPDDVTAHPLQVSIDIASLAPNAEITVFPWKDPPELKARTINRARTFLKRHLPA
jgi:pimeloyl-ACP methyl ester carboxylesterase